jgi:glutamate dehydrogenase (NAD(P)+)
MGTIGERELSAELVSAQNLEEAAKFLDLEPWIVRRLRQCEREVTVNLEIIRDNGEPMMFRGVRVQHCAVRGPYMGPLMFSKDFSESDGHALSTQLTWQSALWELAFGGSAGSIGASLDDLSERESRLLTRAYVEALQGVVGYGRDVLTPERGGHREVNAWALAAMGNTERELLTAVTGKPASLGGIEREKIAALFLRGLITAALREQGMKLAGVRVAIAGFSEESRSLASAFETAGAGVVAVSDRSGAVLHRSHLDVRSLLEFVEKEDVVFGYPGAESISTEEMMQLPCDVLVLSVGQELRVSPKARLVVETGGKVSCILRKETLVVPILLADAGLRIADYLEWRKSACGVVSDRELLRGLQGQVRKTWSEVREHAQRYDISLEKSAMAIGVSRVAQAMRMR